MWECKFTIDGVLHTMTISENDYNSVYNSIINMYGKSKVQIIDIRKI